MKNQQAFSIVLMVTLGALVACGGAAPAESPGNGQPPAAPVDAGAVPSCTLAAGGQTGSKSCLLLLVGAQTCSSLPTTAEQCTCLQSKFKEGTQEAQGYALAIYNCAIQSSCGTDLQCVLQQCGTEWAACRAH